MLRFAGTERVCAECWQSIPAGQMYQARGDDAVCLRHVEESKA